MSLETQSYEDDKKEVEQMEAKDLDHLKNELAMRSEKEQIKHMLKNAEFNRDVKRKFNGFKREMRMR